MNSSGPERSPYSRLSLDEIDIPVSGLHEPPPHPMGLPPGGGNPKKKRRTNNTSMQPTLSAATMQDLLPPPLTGYGDTIVASNPFDDSPQTTSKTIFNPNPQMSQSLQMRPRGLMSGMPPHSLMNSGPMDNQMPLLSMDNMNAMCNINQKPLGAQHIPNHMSGSRLMPNDNSFTKFGNSMGALVDNPMNNSNHHQNLAISSNSQINTGSNCLSSGINSNNDVMPHNHNMLNNNNIHLSNMLSPINTNGQMCNSNQMNSANESPELNKGKNVELNQLSSDLLSNAINGRGVKHSMNIRPPLSHMGYQGPPGVCTKAVPVTIGKIYPPGQPMVFNPQNPNAPPIYPCGICHKEVHDNDQAILCESGCNFWFHRGCTGLSEAAYQLLTQEVYAEWVCDKCLQLKNIPLVKFKP